MTDEIIECDVVYVTDETIECDVVYVTDEAAERDVVYVTDEAAERDVVYHRAHEVQHPVVRVGTDWLPTRAVARVGASQHAALRHPHNSHQPRARTSSIHTALTNLILVHYDSKSLAFLHQRY